MARPMTEPAGLGIGRRASLKRDPGYLPKLAFFFDSAARAAGIKVAANNSSIDFLTRLQASLLSERSSCNARKTARPSRIVSYIRVGIEEGAERFAGALYAPQELPKGYYVKPTVLGRVKLGTRIAQQEIFGAELAIIPYQDEEGAIRIDNDSIYGLSGGLWPGDIECVKRAARRHAHPCLRIG